MLVYGILELYVPLHQTLHVGVISGMVFLPFGHALEVVETDHNDQNYTQLDTSSFELKLFVYASLLLNK